MALLAPALAVALVASVVVLAPAALARPLVHAVPPTGTRAAVRTPASAPSLPGPLAALNDRVRLERPEPVVGAVAASGGWRVQPTPNPTAPNGQLVGDSCSEPTACTAVGNAIDMAGSSGTLAERWNGATWSLQATPNPAHAISSALNAVSCPASIVCVAVGISSTPSGVAFSLAERWNGARWAVTPTPEPAGAIAGGLFGVSCTSVDACTAVGTYTTATGAALTLAEQWNGTGWTVVSTPNPAGSLGSILSQVSCPTATECVGVGNYQAGDSGLIITLAERWNGRVWRVEATPNPRTANYTIFTGVSCGSPRDCLAVGLYRNNQFEFLAVAEHWDGTAWTLRDPGNLRGLSTSGLTAVACVSATECSAIGDDIAVNGKGGMLDEQWNGHHWNVQRMAPRSGGVLNAISCTAADACLAAGDYTLGLPIGRPFGEGWNGTSWQRQRMPSAAGATFSGLTAVSCASTGGCEAVGTFRNHAGTTVALAEGRTGIAWEQQRMPNPAGAVDTELSGVSCSAANDCTAVGNFSANDGTTPLAEGWNGSSWRLESAAIPAGASFSQLRGVSCPSATSCTAVGTSSSGDGGMTPLAEAWNGTTWSLESPVVPPGALFSSLSSVSCPTTTACTAVGYEVTGTGMTLGLAESWNGTSWNIETMPQPAGAVAATPTGVSCSAANACTATGSYQSSTGPQFTLAEGWNGTSWNIETTPNPAGNQSQLTAVSCTTATACTAVGSGMGNGLGVALVESWDGTRWRIRTVPAHPGDASSTLTGVSCTSASSCTAAGNGEVLGPVGSFVQVTLVVATDT